MSGYLLASTPVIDPGPARAAFENLVLQYETRIAELQAVVDRLTGVVTRATYTVKAGDTLTSIGRMFGTTYRTLEKWNNMTTAAIVPGQVIFVAAP